MSEFRSPYVFHFIREGREDLLKSEIQNGESGSFRFSFSKPGFVAFKSDRELDLSELKPGLFSKRHSLQLMKWVEGKESDSRSKLLDALSRISTEAKAFDSRLSVHAFDYRTTLGEEALVSDHAISMKDALNLPLWKSVVDTLSSVSAFQSIQWNKKTLPEECVLNLVQVSDREIWIGVSRPGRDEFLGVGGESGIALPDKAPSRAYLKLEEAIALSQINLKQGDQAVEVGCAPGGACFSLLERGLRVIGVDRAIVAPQISKHPNFKRIGTSVGEMLIPTDFRAQWFLMDMNAEPEIALRECGPLIERIKPGLLGAFLTLKFNREDSLQDLPKMSARAARKLGLEKSWLKNLPSNNREVALFGVTGNYLRSRSL